MLPTTPVVPFARNTEMTIDGPVWKQPGGSSCALADDPTRTAAARALAAASRTPKLTCCDFIVSYPLYRGCLTLCGYAGGEDTLQLKGVKSFQYYCFGFQRR